MKINRTLQFHLSETNRVLNEQEEKASVIDEEEDPNLNFDNGQLMSKSPPISKLGNPYTRHPNNRFGQGSPEFWKAEYQLWGVTPEQYHRIRKEQSPKCPVCGTPVGYSWGTGDCGCGE